MGVADLDGNGTISPLEMMVVQFVATDILDHVATHEELVAMSYVVSEVLGKRPSHVDVKKVVKELHTLTAVAILRGRKPFESLVKSSDEVYWNETATLVYSALRV